MPYEVETELITASGQKLDVFIFYTIKSTGHYLCLDPETTYFPEFTWKRKEYAEIEAIHCFDFDNQPYSPTLADMALWEETITELTQEHFRRIA